MIGSVVGNYKVIGKIGEGGMGVVYKALHTRMDRVCAIKLLLSSNIGDASNVARFYREARIASRINSPHAATIYDFGETDGGLLYLAMEYIDGRTLASVLASKSPLDAKRAIHIADQISSALSVAHALGIVHRDLKPDNIMLTANGTDLDYVKVLDFGIAKSLAHSEPDAVTKTGFVLGTPMYMSPEQVSGRQLDQRSDIYSLALIVYQMLSAKLPFEGDNLQSIMIERVTSDPIRLRIVAPEVSESLEEAVMAGLVRDPNRRIGNAVQFASSLNTTRHLSTAAFGSVSKTADLAHGIARTHLPASVPVPRSTPVALPTMATDHSTTSVLENRLAAQAWLYNKLNWKTYSGALAGLLLAIAVSIPLYVSKSHGVPTAASVGSAAPVSQPIQAQPQGLDEDARSVVADVAPPSPTKRRPRHRANVNANDPQAGPGEALRASDRDPAAEGSNTNKARKVGAHDVQARTRNPVGTKNQRLGFGIKAGFKKIFGGANNKNSDKEP